jgi:hypothetical protein
MEREARNGNLQNVSGPDPVLRHRGMRDAHPGGEEAEEGEPPQDRAGKRRSNAYGESHGVPQF